MPDDPDAKLEMCFGCGADNPQGLHIEYGIDSTGASTTTLCLSEEYSGERGLVHGGIQATVLDEVMGRAAARAVTQVVGERGRSLPRRSRCGIARRVISGNL